MSKSNILKFILSLLSIFLSSNAYHWDGKTIYDLEFKASDSFGVEVSHWTCSACDNTINPMYTLCASDYILGGYSGYNILTMSATGGNYFQRIYTNVPAHNQINFRITVYAIDTWDGVTQSDNFAIKFDSTQVPGINIQNFNPTVNNNPVPTLVSYCGTTALDHPPFQYYITVPHSGSSGSSLTLQLISRLNSAGSDESIGFRDLVMEFDTVTTPLTTAKYCGISSQPVPSNWCLCTAPNQIMLPVNSGTCQNCTSPCATCSGTITTCTSCIYGYYLVGSTCYSPCDSPLQIVTTAGVNYCNTPCPTGIVFWDQSCEAASVCVAPLYSAITIYGYPVCPWPCGDSEYLYWEGSCLSDCPSPLTPTKYKGKNMCTNTCNTYLYWNGSCFANCDPPLVSSNSRLRNYCHYPCKYSWQFLYWNGTCSQYCEFPLGIRYDAGHNYCDYLCDPTEFLYWNGSCKSDCPGGLVTRTQGSPSRNYCDFPCKSTEFLYWNGTCRATCLSPLSSRIEGGRKFCDFPCDPDTLFLYDNASCIATCSLSPFVSVTEGTPSRNYCNFPCVNGEYWATWSSECVSSCSKPLIRVNYGSYDYCNLPCEPATLYYMSDTGKCQASCPYTKISSGAFLYCQVPPAGYEDHGFLFDAPLDPDAVTFVTLVKLMQYVRYLDIEMPRRLERLGISRARSVLNVRSGIHVPKVTVENLAKRKSPPEVFESHSLSPGFVVNYWFNLTSIMIGLGVIVFLHVVQMICKALQVFWLKEIFQVLKIILGWGYITMLFCIDIDDIILYGAMEFKTINLVSSTTLSSLSFFLCLTFIGVMIATMICICLIVNKKRYNLDTSPSIHAKRYIAKFERTWDWCQILYRGFKSTNFVTEYFYLIYIIRIAFPMLIVVWSYRDPVVITIFEVLISLCILGLLMYQKPFIKRVNQIQIMILESIVLLMNICMLIITALDAVDIKRSSFAIFLGDVVIIGNVILNFMVLLFLLIRIVLEIQAINLALTKANIKGRRSIAAWLQLLALPLQQANMGFEEMITYDFTYICPKDNRVGIMQVIEDDAHKHGAGDETEIKSHISFDQADRGDDGMTDFRPATPEKLNNNYTLNRLMPDSEKPEEEDGDETNRNLKGDFRQLTPTGIGRKSRFFSIIPSQYESWDPEGKNVAPGSMNENLSAHDNTGVNYGEISLQSVEVASPVRREGAGAKRRLISKVGQRSQLGSAGSHGLSENNFYDG